MNQKEEKLKPRYGIMSSRQTIQPKGKASHEHDSTRGKEKASSSKKCSEKRETLCSVDELNEKMREHLCWSNRKTMRTLGRKSPLELLKEAVNHFGQPLVFYLKIVYNIIVSLFTKARQKCVQ